MSRVAPRSSVTPASGVFASVGLLMSGAVLTGQIHAAAGVRVLALVTGISLLGAAALTIEDADPSVVEPSAGDGATQIPTELERAIQREIVAAIDEGSALMRPMWRQSRF